MAERLDVAHRHQVAEIFARKPVTIAVDDIGVKLRVRPADKFSEIRFDATIEAAFVDSAASDATRRIAEHVAGVREARPNPVSLERII